ncbi:unnamed protein product [Pocillopora meandrina]|uniref:Uncharacterized protein n=1 Tax=Pocillopora meandrina TaxID=46732 RepID=A0AAU9XWA7_9CNID|nr:unnamed protein product [Pocillopora meandrina]
MSRRRRSEERSTSPSRQSKAKTIQRWIRLKFIGVSLRMDYLTRTLVNLDGNCTPTDEIVERLGEANRYIRDIDVQSIACAVQYAPKIYSGGCGRPPFEIKEEQLSFVIDQGFQVPVIAQLFRVSTRTIERRMQTYGLSTSGKPYDHFIF